MAGLSSTGFVGKTVTEVKTAIEAYVQSKFGIAARLIVSVFENLIGVVSSQISELWDGEQALYSATNPDNAQGVALDNICAITGTIRTAAASTVVTAYCSGTPGTILATGRVASITVTGIRFASTADATILTLPIWVAAASYVVGDTFYWTDTVDLITRAYYTHTNFSSGGNPDPTSTKRIGLGTGAVAVEFAAEDVGPIPAGIYTLTVIETPVSGWNGVLNVAAETDLGNLDETDPELRFRREDELSFGGINTDAIRAAVLSVNGVTQCTVFSNVTNVTDGDGVPAHAIEVVALGGTDADIRAALWAACGGLVQTHGSTSGTITDEQGFSQTVKFSRPTPITVHVIVNVTRDTTVFPATGTADIKAALVAYAGLQKFGRNVVSDALKAQLFPVINGDGVVVSGITGIIDFTSLLIGLADPPTVETTLAVGTREIMSIITANIDVNLSAGTP